MIILVEGNEGTGKTTLINEIIKKKPFVYVKYTKEIPNTDELYNTLLRCDDNIIFDRSFITDMVYRCWDGKKPQTTLDMIGFLLSHKDRFKIIFCHNDNSFKNAKLRGEDFITTQEIHDIIETHFKVIQRLIELYTEVPCYSYDYDYNSVEDVIEFLRKEE